MSAEGGGIVALLFTDLVGSTSMYDQLGDDRAEAVRRAHFARSAKRCWRTADRR